MVIQDKCRCLIITDPFLPSEHSPLCPVFASYAELEHSLANTNVQQGFFQKLLNDLFP